MYTKSIKYLLFMNTHVTNKDSSSINASNVYKGYRIFQFWIT